MSDTNEPHDKSAPGRSGGTLTITGTSNPNDNQASIQLGHWPSIGFNYNLSGGTFHAPATLMTRRTRFSGRISFCASTLSRVRRLRINCMTM